MLTLKSCHIWLCLYSSCIIFARWITKCLPNAHLQGVIREYNILQHNTKCMNYKTSVSESEAKKIRSVYTIYFE